MKKSSIAMAFAASLLSLAASAQETPVTIGYAGWTGFAPLTLAKEAGIFKKNGLDVTLKKIPQASRHLAIQSGDVQCAATTVETWVVWNANGVPTKQIFQMDKSYGADGMVVGSVSTGHSALFHARLVFEEKRFECEGCHRCHDGAGPGGPSLYRRPE